MHTLCNQAIQKWEGVKKHWAEPVCVGQSNNLSYDQNCETECTHGFVSIIYSIILFYSLFYYSICFYYLRLGNHLLWENNIALSHAKT